MEADPWSGSLLAASILLLLFLGALSALETAILNARRSRLSQMASGRRLREAEAVLDAPERFQASAHLARSLAESLLYAMAALLGLRFWPVPAGAPAGLPEWLRQGWPGVLLGALIGYLAVVLLGETLPKLFAMQRPERLLLRCLGFVRLFPLPFAPVLWLVRRTARVLALPGGAEAVPPARLVHSEEEIKQLVEESAEEGVLEEEEKEMIHSIFEFTETVARQVMVPRVDIRSISADATVEDAVREIIESGHSRLPVYEGTLDNIVGVIHVKDLLPPLLAGDRNAPVRAFMREPYFVPEGKKIDELLQEFRRNKSRMAIVVDEYGGTSGLVTVEDVLEVIVGEIEDEYHVEEGAGPELVPTPEGAIVDARMTIDDVNEALGLSLPHGDYDTIGGFVMSLFGRAPHAGERVRYENVELVVEAVEGVRLQKIRIVVLQPRPEQEREPVS